MQSRGNRVVGLCLMLAAGGDLVGCAVYSGALIGANGGWGGAVASAGASASGSGGVGSPPSGDGASSGDGALVGSDSGSGGSAGAVGQGGSAAAVGGGGAQGGGASTDTGAGSGNGGAGASGSSGGNGGSDAHGGSAGAGGSSGAADCKQHPLTAKSSWTITASSASAASPLTNVDDGNLATRWSTGVSQKSDWLQVDFGADVSLDTITLAIGDSSSDYPRAYEVRLSELSQNHSAVPLASGKGQEAMDTVIDLPKPALGRYLLISQTGTINGTWWSVAELKVACLH